MAKIETQQMSVDELYSFINDVEDTHMNYQTRVLYKYPNDDDSDACEFGSVKFVKTETKDGIKREMIFILP